MHLISWKAAKALFFILNHVAATHVPRDLIQPKLSGRKSANGLWGASQRDIQKAIADKWGKEINVFLYKKCNDCRKDCPKDQIVDQDDCTKCKACPAKQKANRAQDKCIKDKKRAVDEKKKKERKAWRKKAVPRKKDLEQKRWDRERDEKKRRQTRRMGRCLVIVPLLMGAAVVDELDDLFDEDWINSMEMVDFWPSDLKIDDYKADDELDKKLEDEKYIDEYVNIGNSAKRDTVALVGTEDNIPAAFQRAPAPRDVESVSNATALTVREYEELYKRAPPCVVCLLVPLFSAVIASAKAAAKAVGKGGKGGATLQAGNNVAKGAIKIGGGRNQKSKADQKKGTEKVSKNHNWKNCLQGKSPSK